MRPLARKLRAIFAAQFANMVAYRAEIFVWMLTGTLSFIMMALWIAQANAAPGGRVGGFDAGDFASYFTGTWVTGQFLVVWVVWEMDFQIRQGTLSPKLLRPLDPIWEHVGTHLAEKIVRLPIIALFVAALLLFVPGLHLTPDPRMWAAYTGLVLLGFGVRFLLETCLGTLAFWTESVTSVNNLSFLAYAALGGIFAPLALYPPELRLVASLTPYPYLVNLPARMLAGSAAWPEVGAGALVLAGWFLALLGLRQLLWRGGLKRYGAVGA